MFRLDKFAPLCTENVLAQRIRMIDNDEIRTIVLALKRQIENGTPLPETEDIWDEELLDKAQIDRPWITQRNLRPGDKTTEELARELDWPVPSVFVAKQKSADGEYRPVVHMLLGKEQRGDGEDAEDDEDSDHRIVSVEKSPSFQNPVDYHLIPVGETVEYETINVEEVEGGGELISRQYPGAAAALRRGRPRGATQRATISPHRSNLTRILLSEANYIKTLVAANVTFQNDQELMRWIHKLREVRKELNDSSKREGHTMQTPADAYFDHLVHEDILRDERKRPYDTAFTPINGNTDLGIVSDDEELITQTTQGHIHYRPELWN